MSDNFQLVKFIRSMDEDFNIIEEILNLKTFQDTTKVFYIYEACLQSFN